MHPTTLKPFLGVLLALCATEALAGKAATDATISGGSRVRILDIAAGDSNYANRYKYIGKLGTVDKSGLYNNSEGGVFYSGDIEMDTGDRLLAYQVSVELLGGPPSSIKGTPYKGSSVRRGSWLRILEIGPSDTNYPNRGQIVGKICFVADYELYPSYYGGSGMFTGTVYGMDGGYLYFQAVSVELINDSKFKEKPFKGATVPLYTRIKVKSISSSDGLYSLRGSIVGKEGFVSSSPLYNAGAAPGGGTYYSGSISFFDGSYEYFSQAEMSGFELDAPGSFSSGAGIIPMGTKVEIQAIGDLDKYYLKRKGIEGMVGVVGSSEALRVREGGFYSGTITVMGTEYNFFQVMVSPLGGGLPSPTGKLPATLEPGYRVMILDVSSTDGNSTKKGDSVGQQGVVVHGNLVLGTGPWYSGAIKGDNGRYFFFSQVAVLPLAPPTGVVPEEPPERLAVDPSLMVGQEVRILDIGPSDPYYSTRSSYLGKKATVTSYPMSSYGTSPTTGGYYYSGTLTVDGIPISFSQISLNLIEKKK